MLGLVLFLLGLFTGTAVPLLKNPQMGLASHLQGMTNGPFLILVGAIWPHVHLPQLWQFVAVALLSYGTYANWLATLFGALWGAGSRFAPVAAGDYRAAATPERVVDPPLLTLAPAMVTATILLIVGVLR